MTMNHRLKVRVPEGFQHHMGVTTKASLVLHRSGVKRTGTAGSETILRRDGKKVEVFRSRSLELHSDGLRRESHGIGLDCRSQRSKAPLLRRERLGRCGRQFFLNRPHARDLIDEGQVSAKVAHQDLRGFLADIGCHGTWEKENEFDDHCMTGNGDVTLTTTGKAEVGGFFTHFRVTM